MQLTCKASKLFRGFFLPATEILANTEYGIKQENVLYLVKHMSFSNTERGCCRGETNMRV